MISLFLHLALFLELVSSLNIPTQNNERGPALLNLVAAPHNVPVSKVRRQGSQLQSRGLHRRHESNSTLIRPTNSNLQYAVEVKFNGVPRYLLLDTGSSDTWMFAEDFQCKNANGTSVPQSQCKIGQPYTGEGLDIIKGETFSIIYGNNENPTGPMGYADVSVAGLTVEGQQVALVDNGYWQGDGVLSGVFGIGDRGLTSAYTPGSDLPHEYTPIFESLYNTTRQVNPLFSLALQRGEAGGYLALGGLPPVDFKPDFVTTKMLGIPYGTEGGTRAFYSIEAPGYTLNGKTHNESFFAIVDSGTFVNRFPTDAADKINAAFNPPAIYIPSADFYVTSCNATVPSFGISIGDKTFQINPTDMWLVDEPTGLCATSITRGFPLSKDSYPDGLYVLGDVFLHNVVVVFDVGNKQMHFAPHTKY
ncbi:aspartic peptidase domain-containing protein [Talaromyces proteolyticus]|uniref:Aspartic peptidase domain-containing protein n=1 Tax=Talaromyces proteolyticus TaxID=1131652 RepID=A0AAD4KVF1_9EURO|nr:aspartic peptidase domain-containing protein [Talaromyces proteolyticus]KAH8701953.1 aspartic peptidase domain-containing protein [Talaromyces proteolyticus]